MSDYAEQFYELCEQAYGTPSVAKVELFEAAVRLADTHQDVGLGIEGRMDLIECAVFAGCVDRAVPAMGWLLAKTDGDAELLKVADQYTLMWSYKWIAADVAAYPGISLKQINSMADDLARRYKDLGYDQHAVYGVHLANDLMLGNAERLKDTFKRWKAEPRGDMSDCHACEVNREVCCHLLWGELDAALRAAEPLVNRRMSCSTVPFTTYGHLLLPLFDANQLELADTYQRRAQRSIVHIPSELGHCGHHMAFLALTDQANRAVRLLDKHLPGARAMTGQDQRFDFFTGAAVLLRVLLGQGRETVKLRRHEGLNIEPDAEGQYEVVALERWFDDASRDIAERFDQRAGTGYWASLRKEAFARVGHIKPYKRPKKEA